MGLKLRSKSEIAIIKQKILDFCTEFKTTSQIAKNVGLQQQIIFGYMESLVEKRFLERIEARTKTRTRCYMFRALNPIYKEVRINESTNAMENKYNWIPLGFMDIQVKNHEVKGRVIKMDDEKMGNLIKQADKARREENNKKATSKVYVSGSTLHMAV